MQKIGLITFGNGHSLAMTAGNRQTRPVVRLTVNRFSCDIQNHLKCRDSHTAGSDLRHQRVENLNAPFTKDRPLGCIFVQSILPITRIPSHRISDRSFQITINVPPTIRWLTMNAEWNHIFDPVKK